MKRYISAILLLLPFAVAVAQQKGVTMDDAVLRAMLVENVLVPEKVYVQFDNTAYYLNDTIWFKASVTCGNDNRPGDVSRILYVELVSPEGYVVKTEKYKLADDGTCVGELYLDPLYLSGYFEVRAYTRYMLNWGDAAIFSRVFPVFDKVNGNNWEFKNMLDRRRAFARDGRWYIEKDNERVLRFYPEGGHLVAGLPARVAFELQGVRGVECSDTITLLADGKLLLRAAPVHMGKGVFEFTPQDGVKYRAEVRVKNEKGKHEKHKIPLPSVEKEGVALSLNSAADSVRVAVHCNYPEKADLGFAFLHRSSVCYYTIIRNNEENFAVAAADLPEGVNRAVVFSGSTPLAERLFFVEHSAAQAGDNRAVQLRVHAGGRPLHKFEPRACEKVNLTVERTDSLPIEEDACFALSVVDNAGRQQTSWSYNHYSYLLLGSEVKGYIPDAAQYFDVLNPRRREHLDLVMLTNGWTAYDWSKLAAHSLSGLAEPEKEITLCGKFYLKTYGRVAVQPYNLVRFDASYSGDSIFTSAFRTDSKGAFRIVMRDFKGRRVMALSPNTKMKHSTGKIQYSFVLDRYFSPRPRFLHWWERNLGAPQHSYLQGGALLSGITNKANEYFMLENIDVTAKKRQKRFAVPPMSELTLDYLDEWEYAMDKFSQVRPASYIDSLNNEYKTVDYYSNSPTGAFDKSEGMRDLEYEAEFMREGLWQYRDVLSANDVVQSIMHRYALSHCYWVYNVVVKGDYHKDSTLVIDHEYLHGINVDKMTNFNKIVITSDARKTGLVKGGNSKAFWEFKGFAYANKGKHAFFYNGFLTPNIGISYPGSIDKEDHFVRNIKAMGDPFKGHSERPDSPSRLACFIPFKEGEKRDGILPDLGYATSTRRYTSVQGYSESKQFYSPSYASRPLPTDDYRRTLLWAPAVKPVDGKLQLEFYNSSHCSALAVNVEGRSGNTFYCTDNRLPEKSLAVVDSLPAAETNIKKLSKKMKEYVAAFKRTGYVRDSIFWQQCEDEFQKAEIIYSQKKYSRCLTSYIELSQFGHAGAFYRIGLCYKNGYALKKNPSLAFSFMQRAAEKGYAAAQYDFAILYRDSVGCEPNEDATLYWLERAIEQGEPRAIYEMAHILFTHEEYLDSVRGGELLRLSALKNKHEALYRYAVFMQARGIVADSLVGTPLQCVEKAAALKNGDAMNYLLAHEDSCGNYAAAYQWARELHWAKDHRGTKYMADCLMTGRVKRRNKRLAKDLYRDAARAGNAEAAKILQQW